MTELIYNRNPDNFFRWHFATDCLLNLYTHYRRDSLTVTFMASGVTVTIYVVSALACR